MISACSKMTSTSGSVETLRTVRSALHDNPDMGKIDYCCNTEVFNTYGNKSLSES